MINRDEAVNPEKFLSVANGVEWRLQFAFRPQRDGKYCLHSFWKNRTIDYSVQARQDCIGDGMLQGIITVLYKYFKYDVRDG